MEAGGGEGLRQLPLRDASHRLTNIQNTAGASVVGLGYDAQGNVSNRNGHAYVFDYGNRLRMETGVESYRYDGHGRRVEAWAPQGNILSLYGQSGQLLFEENQRKPGTQANVHVYLGGSLIATRERNYASGAVATKYQHTDALGSPVAVTNEAGAVIDRTQWEPYGAAIGKPAYQGIGYTGHVMDGATGLTYMQQRYYDPQIGRFLSVDPVTAYSSPGANFNRYWYANNNPYRFIDPDGRKPRDRGAAYISDSMSGVNVNSAERNGMANIPRSWRDDGKVLVGPIENADLPPPELIEAARSDLAGFGDSKLENGTVGYEDGDGYRSEKMDPVLQSEIKWLVGAGAVYLTHTHGNIGEWFRAYFSTDDTNAANSLGIPVFLANFKGDLRMYTPGMRTGNKIRSGEDVGRQLQGGQSTGILICQNCMPIR